MYIDKIMTSHVISINEQTRLNKMVELMQEHALEHLPVVREESKLVGIISLYDIQKAAPSAITTLSMGEANYLLAKITAQEIMQKEVVFCHKETLIEEAGQIMRKHNISSLPIVQDEHLVGIVTMEDILDFFLDITGCHLEGATRIAVRLSDKKGSLSDFLKKINELNGYIATVVSPTEIDNEGRRICIVRYYSDDPHTIDEQLKRQGFELISENFLSEQQMTNDTSNKIAHQEKTKAEKIGKWIIGHDHLARSMGIQIKHVEKGGCSLTMKVISSLINAAGVVHGGAVFALADIACAIAANTHNNVSLTVNGNVSFLTSTKEGDTLIAQTKEISKGNMMATYQVEVRRSSDNALTAMFMGTVFRKKDAVSLPGGKIGQ